MHYLRAHMAPESLELLLFLYCNKEYWDSVAVLDNAMLWGSERRKARRAAEEAAAAAAAARAAEGDFFDDESDE